MSCVCIPYELGSRATILLRANLPRLTPVINRVAICMIAYNGGHNPFQTLAFLSLSHPILLHSILSVATGYLHNSGRSCANILSVRQSRSLNSLQAALNLLLDSGQPSGEVDRARLPPQSQHDGDWGIFSTLNTREVALATIMMQLSSTLTTGLGNAEGHLKCALHFLKDLDYIYRPPHSTFARMFVHRFALADVVLAFLRFRRTIAPPDFYMYQTGVDVGLRQPSFYELHGCPERVLCFLAEISVLGADLTEGRCPPHEVQDKAFDLEMQMRVWSQGSHPFASDGKRDGTGNHGGAEKGHKGDSVLPDAAQPAISSQHQSQTLIEKRAQLEIVGECFFCTARLLLMRRVFFDPTESARVQFIRRRLFELMKRLPAGCGPDTFVTFPFYMAAREAISSEDRQWVRQHHADLAEFYRDRPRKYIMASTEKIWEQNDVMDDPATHKAEPWNSPRERFIRELDSTSTYFMY